MKNFKCKKIVVKDLVCFEDYLDISVKMKKVDKVTLNINQDMVRTNYF